MSRNRRLPSVRVLRVLLLLVAFGVANAGCDDRRPAPPQAAQGVPKVPAGDGVVRGVVTFSGVAPQMADIPNSPCHDGAPPLKEETVVVDPTTGGLANVVVYLKDVRLDGALPAGAVGKPPVLDQLHCRYTPHVVAVEAGKPLAVRTSDDTIHNVHYTPDNNPAANFSMTAVGQEKIVSFVEPELAVRMKCDVHPWMTAYVAVMDNPWFAVTDDKGRFEIDHLPPGTYTLATWHERYGELTQRVTVGAGGDVKFDYKP